MVAEIVESTTSARCIQQIQRASDLRRVDVSLLAFQCGGFEDREDFQDGHGSLEVALYTVLSVCNLQRSCLLRQTFWDATQASCDHQEKFSHASFSTVTWSLLKPLHPHNRESGL